MNIFKSIQSSLARYFVFTGRSTRSDFWYFLLFYFILLFGAIEIDNKFDHLNTLFFISDDFNSGLDLVVSLLFLLPLLTLSVRRLRDIGESGWWMLLFFPIDNDFLIIDDFVNVYNVKFIIFSYVILVWSMWWLGFRKSL